MRVTTIAIQASMTLEVVREPYTGESVEQQSCVTRELARGLEQEIHGLEMTLQGKRRQLSALRKSLSVDNRSERA